MSAKQVERGHLARMSAAGATDRVNVEWKQTFWACWRTLGGQDARAPGEEYERPSKTEPLIRRQPV
ncbi:MAG: hypothetical protein LC770_08545 [Acidobacteria bacterium]|nr:hypothetical protein [Acidobacteriota bacterium]